MSDISNLYPDLPSTNFPESVDDFIRFSDPTAEDLPLMNQFNGYIASGDLASATALLNANPQLGNKIINADRLNKLRDGVIATQKYYLNDVQQYLVEIVKAKGLWSNSITYTKYDVVLYTVDGATQSYMGIKTIIPIGTLPTNGNYFYPITLRGEQGSSGTGLSPRGYWSSATLYYQYDFVTYNNALWYAAEENTGRVPDPVDPTWVRFLSLTHDVLTSNTQPSNQSPGDIWNQKDANNNIKIKVKNSDGSYAQLFPETKAASVSMSDGKSVEEAVLSRSPNNHASTSGDYGLATGTDYAHVKLSDSIDSTDDISSGVAATPAAVKTAYDLAATHTHSDATTSAAGLMSAADKTKLDTAPVNITTAINARSTTVRYTATITTNWSGSGPWTQTVPVTGMLATDYPIVDVVVSTTDATARNQLIAWGMVDSITTAANQITVKCLNAKPTTEIPIQLRVVR